MLPIPWVASEVLSKGEELVLPRVVSKQFTGLYVGNYSEKRSNGVSLTTELQLDARGVIKRARTFPLQASSLLIIMLHIIDHMCDQAPVLCLLFAFPSHAEEQQVEIVFL